jgi:hypothetical protein
MLNIRDLGVDLQGWIMNNLISEIEEISVKHAI